MKVLIVLIFILPSIILSKEADIIQIKSYEFKKEDNQICWDTQNQCLTELWITLINSSDKTIRAFDITLSCKSLLGDTKSLNLKSQSTRLIKEKQYGYTGSSLLDNIWSWFDTENEEDFICEISEQRFVH